MKKLSLLLLVAVFFAACGTTPEKSAQKLIKAYMPTVIENYEPGTFDTLDSVFSRLECNPEYVKMQENLVAGQESLAQAEEQIANYKPKQEAYEVLSTQIENAKNLIEEAQAWIDSAKANFMPEFVGYTMNHEYTFTNEEGEKVVANKDFFINPELTEIKVCEKECQKDK